MIFFYNNNVQRLLDKTNHLIQKIMYLSSNMFRITYNYILLIHLHILTFILLTILKIYTQL